MSKCIQVSCNCTGYKEPAQLQSKSTLLQFRQNCHECGHFASEHRRLTAVDQFIKSQVSVGKRTKCAASILPSEIPLSPVFSRYDLIPIPRDDDNGFSPNTENSVQCTCRGFKISDVIRLCQKFRTHSLNDVEAELKDTPCSFCAHPLSSHATTKQEGSKDFSNFLLLNMKPALGAYEGLALKQSSSLHFTPVNHNCLELVMPSDMSDDFVLLSVGKCKDSDLLRLAVTCQVVDTQVDAMDTADCCSNVVVAESPNEDTKNVFSSSRKRGRKRHPSSPVVANSQKRRSVRLATKKAREEEKKILEKLKGLKGITNFSEMYLIDSDLDEIEDLSELEYKQVTESTVNFVEQLSNGDNYQTFPLPQEMVNVDVVFLLMSALKITENSPSQDIGNSSQDTAPTRVLVAIGTKEKSDIFLAIVSSDQSSVVLHWHRIECQEEGTLECLLLREVAMLTADSAKEMLVMVGMSSGWVCIWRVVLEQGRLKDTLPLATFNCGSQCLAISCATSRKAFAAGTVLGQVVLCLLTSGTEAVEQAQPHLHMQTVSCCSAPIRCITWSQDDRLVAVGACDDTIQVLQCVQPPKEDPITKGSILNYVRRTESRQPRFIHVYTLKGHTSFIADMQFTGSSGHLLASMGWDGQLLFWKHLVLHHSHLGQGPQHRTKLSCRSRGDRVEPELLEPVGGYKLGPSLAVEFLPLLLRPVMGCGLVVAMGNQLGGVTVGCYVKNSVLN